MKKVLSVLLLWILLIVPLTASAHSGSTDSSGGHRDSSTGTYHYHHGYPAHDHEDGICPYNFDDATEPSYSSKSSATTVPQQVIHSYDGSSYTRGYEDGHSVGFEKGYEEGYAQGGIDIESTVQNEASAVLTKINRRWIIGTGIYLLLSLLLVFRLRHLKERCEGDLAGLRADLRALERIKGKNEEEIAALYSDLNALAEEKEQLLAELALPEQKDALQLYADSADYLEHKPRPAPVEARRIRELQRETQNWVFRAYAAERRLKILEGLEVVQLHLKRHREE